LPVGTLGVQMDRGRERGWWGKLWGNKRGEGGGVTNKYILSFFLSLRLVM